VKLAPPRETPDEPSIWSVFIKSPDGEYRWVFNGFDSEKQCEHLLTSHFSKTLAFQYSSDHAVVCGGNCGETIELRKLENCETVGEEQVVGF
jgi:hypothetical protein